MYSCCDEPGLSGLVVPFARVSHAALATIFASWHTKYLHKFVLFCYKVFIFLLNFLFFMHFLLIKKHVAMEWKESSYCTNITMFSSVCM